MLRLTLTRAVSGVLSLIERLLEFVRRHPMLAVGYLGLIHAATLALALNVVPGSRFREGFFGSGSLEGECGRYYEITLGHQRRLDRNLDPGAVLLVGDSLIQGMPAGAVAPGGVNYGIGGDTTRGVLQRMAFYSSLRTARAVVLAVGGNDFKYRGDDALLANYENILKAVPAEVAAVVVALLPVDEMAMARRGIRHRANVATLRLNRELSRLCTERAGVCRFVGVDERFTDARGNLLTEIHEGDGVHLSPLGYRMLIAALHAAVEALPPRCADLTHG